MTNGTFSFDPCTELEEWVTPTPLSDPIFTAIFQDVDTAGLAMRSLLNATLTDSGDKQIMEIVTLTPQSVHSETSSRGFRIDVEAKTDSGEIALVEVQLKPFTAMIERALLYAEQSLASGARRGDTLEKVISTMPRVIVVNLLEKALRISGGYHQIVEMLYREPPYQRATDRLQVHNLELDKYRRNGKAVPETPLECWLTAICRSQDEKKPLTEVVKMDPKLKELYDSDPGFAQFVERHGLVASMPELRKAYRRWENDIMLDKLDEERRNEEVKLRVEEGEARGRAEGIAIEKIETARRFLELGLSIDEVAAGTQLSIEDVKTISDEM